MLTAGSRRSSGRVLSFCSHLYFIMANKYCCRCWTSSAQSRNESQHTAASLLASVQATVHNVTITQIYVVFCLCIVGDRSHAFLQLCTGGFWHGAAALAQFELSEYRLSCFVWCNEMCIIMFDHIRYTFRHLLYLLYFCFFLNTKYPSVLQVLTSETDPCP